MVRECLTIVASYGTVTVTRMANDFELPHRVGGLIPDGTGGAWLIEEITAESRCLVVSEFDDRLPHVLELLEA
jgi:hypothetical protein